MTKYLISVIIALGLALVTVTYGYTGRGKALAVKEATLQGLVEAQEQALLRLRKDRSTLVARDKTIAAQRVLVARAQEGVQKALQSNSDWSNTNVPTDVQEAILGRSGGPQP